MRVATPVSPLRVVDKSLSPHPESSGIGSDTRSGPDRLVTGVGPPDTRATDFGADHEDWTDALGGDCPMDHRVVFIADSLRDEWTMTELAERCQIIRKTGLQNGSTGMRWIRRTDSRRPGRPCVGRNGTVVSFPQADRRSRAPTRQQCACDRDEIPTTSSKARSCAPSPPFSSH